jgi:hypothetical protein
MRLFLLPSKRHAEAVRRLQDVFSDRVIQHTAAASGSESRDYFTMAIRWAFAASVVAVGQALDYTSSGRALAVCGLGLLLSLLIAIVLGLLFGPTLSGF